MELGTNSSLPIANYRLHTVTFLTLITRLILLLCLHSYLIIYMYVVNLARQRRFRNILQLSGRRSYQVYIRFRMDQMLACFCFYYSSTLSRALFVLTHQIIGWRNARVDIQIQLTA